MPSGPGVSVHDQATTSKAQGRLALDGRDLWSIVAPELGDLPPSERYWALGQFDHQVAWGTVSSGGIAWDPASADEDHQTELLLDLRIFGADRELHLSRTSSNAFSMRLRLDSTGKTSRVLDEVQYLWGTSKGLQGADGNWVELVEGRRGIRLNLPWPAPSSSDLPLKLGVRSYLVSDARGLVDICDVRLCGLFPRTATWPARDT